MRFGDYAASIMGMEIYFQARALGVRKMCSIAEAKNVCPQVRIVDGSDLAPFRKASQEINELWFEKMSEFGLTQIEKKGFDETFMDITEIVEHRLSKYTLDSEVPIGFEGKVVGKNSVDNPEKKRILQCLSIGSQIAQEWRYFRVFLP